MNRQTTAPLSQIQPTVFCMAHVLRMMFTILKGHKKGILWWSSGYDSDSTAGGKGSILGQGTSRGKKKGFKN